MITSKGLFELYEESSDFNLIDFNENLKSENKFSDALIGCFGKIQIPQITRTTYKRKNWRSNREIEMPDTLTHSHLILEAPVYIDGTKETYLIDWFYSYNREIGEYNINPLLNAPSFSMIPPIYEKAYKDLILVVFAGGDNQDPVRVFRFLNSLPVALNFSDLEGGSEDPFTYSCDIAVTAMESYRVVKKIKDEETIFEIEDYI